MMLLTGMARLITEGYDPFGPEPQAAAPGSEPAIEASADEPPAGVPVPAREATQVIDATLHAPAAVTPALTPEAAAAVEAPGVEPPAATPASIPAPTVVELPATAPTTSPAWTILTPIKWKNGWPAASGGTIRVQDNAGQVHLVTPFPPKMWCMTCKSDTCSAGQAILDGKPAAKQARGRAA
jgi:hypothetical protein